MNTTEILNKSLAWLHTKERSTIGTCQNISKLLLGINNYNPCQSGGSELSEEEAHLYHFVYNVKYTLNHHPEAVGIARIAPQELYVLTQVILQTLNTEPGRFHNMSELPGLESRNWYQLGQIARYLLKQGWIEMKAMRIGFLIKLTIDGKIHVGNHDAWA